MSIEYGRFSAQKELRERRARDIADEEQVDGFSIVDLYGKRANAGERGLLLYRGGTVCDDSFSDISANVICREIGYIGALNWVSGSEYSYGETQTSLRIALDEVTCQDDDWASCSYSTTHDCGHSEDVFLTCLEGIGEYTFSR